VAHSKTDKLFDIQNPNCLQTLVNKYSLRLQQERSCC